MAGCADCGSPLMKFAITLNETWNGESNQMPVDPAFIRVCPQRHNNDCAVCCFVMLLGVSYEVALLAVGRVDPQVATNGLYFTQLKKAAAGLGMHLKSKRRYDVQNDCGILGVQFADKTEHAVILFRGTIIDPDGGVVWDDVESYVESTGASLRSLLVLC